MSFYILDKSGLKKVQSNTYLTCILKISNSYAIKKKNITKKDTVNRTKIQSSSSPKCSTKTSFISKLYISYYCNIMQSLMNIYIRLKYIFFCVIKDGLNMYGTQKCNWAVILLQNTKGSPHTTSCCI